MAVPRGEPKIVAQVMVNLSAQELEYLQRLLSVGIYGLDLEEVILRIVDRFLIERG